MGHLRLHAGLTLVLNLPVLPALALTLTHLQNLRLTLTLTLTPHLCRWLRATPSVLAGLWRR